jgi:hypothetical protein
MLWPVSKPSQQSECALAKRRCSKQSRDKNDYEDRELASGQDHTERPCRLTLALWIVRRDKPRFYQSEPPREVILEGDRGKELNRLVTLGMLEEQRPEDGRRVYYERIDNPLWQIIEAASDVLGPL